MSKVKFLGHVISQERVVVDPSKVKAVVNLERNENASEVRSFLGLEGYYWRFILGICHLALPLTRLTWKDVPFKGYSNYERIFKDLKENLTVTLVLIIPDPT